MEKISIDQFFWLFLLVIAVSGVVLGVTGWIDQIGINCELRDIDCGLSGGDLFVEAAYRTIILFFAEGSHQEVDPSNWRLQAARIVAPVTMFFAIFRVFAEIFMDKFLKWRIRRLRDHSIVCGLSEHGRAFALSESNARRTVVAIEASPTPSQESFCALHRIRLVRGDCRDKMVLRAAATPTASRLIVVTGNDNANLDTAMRARSLVEDKTGSDTILLAYVSINSRGLWQEISRSDSIEYCTPGFEMRPFNLGVLAARRFIWDEPLYTYADLRGQRFLHLVFIGFNEYAESLIAQLFPACVYKEMENPAITVLTTMPQSREERLRMNFPEIDGSARLTFHDFDPSNRQLDEALMMSISDKGGVSAIFVCQETDDAALGAALSVHESMRRHNRWNAPVYVRMSACDGVEDLLVPASKARYFSDIIQSFGTERDLCTLDLIDGPLEQFACQIHDAYQKTRAMEANPGDDSTRQESLPSWRELRETYRESNRRAADHIKAKLASAGCWVPAGLEIKAPEGFQLCTSRQVVEALSSLEHQSWRIGRQIDGWRPGPRRDNRRKIHPELLNDYDALDEKTKDYDRHQIQLIDKYLIKRIPDKPGNQPLVRHDHWIGLIGLNQISEADALWMQDQLRKIVLPRLIKRFPGALFTLVTPLAPGSDLVLTEAVLVFFRKQRICRRLLVVEGVPDAFMIEDYRETYEAGSAWNGKVPPAGQLWHDAANPEESARTLIKNARDKLIGDKDTEWVIDLTQGEADYGAQEVRQVGYRAASDYIIERCHTLIASMEDGREVKAGSVAESLIRRKDLAEQKGKSTWPDPFPRSTFRLDLKACSVNEFKG